MLPEFFALNGCLILLALAIDRITGDPHTPWHPVALLGRVIGWWGRPALYGERSARVAGAVFWAVTVALFTLPFLLFQAIVPWYFYLPPGAVLLKVCMAWRSLEEHAAAVNAGLRNGIGEGRASASLLVSRDTSQLTGEQVRSAAYESLSENLVDSIVSPLVYSAIFGIAGAAFQRAANTMDAMLGYTDERKALGWWSARADDVINYLPARLTGFFLLVWFWTRGRLPQARAGLRQDRRKRPGFNGGIPISIMAGGAGVCFEKPGVYRIGFPERTLEEAGPDIIAASRACVLLFSASLAIVLLLLQLLLNSTGI